MRPALLRVALLLPAGGGAAQDAASLEDSAFARVAIEGSLNFRDGPSTKADRLARLPDGTLMRVIACRAGGDEEWCELETIAGDIEGWAAARFLRPHRGADPGALASLAIAASAQILPGTRGGTLAAGEVIDFGLTAPADSAVSVTLAAPSGVRGVVVGSDGRPLSETGAEGEAVVLFPEGGEMVIRLADMDGDGGDWTLHVRVD